MDAVIKKIPREARSKRPSQEEAEAAVRTLLAWAGDNPDREGLLDTPRRVAKAFREYFSGYEEDPAEALSRTFEDVGGYDDIVMLRDIEFNSHCEHHIAPFIGRAHVAYLPTRAVVGISKLARVVEIFARRLQTQETMTAQIANSICGRAEARAASPCWSRPCTPACRCAASASAMSPPSPPSSPASSSPTRCCRRASWNWCARPPAASRSRWRTALDETTAFQPRFDAAGLIPAIVTDARDGTVLMFAYMNAEALGSRRRRASPISGAARARPLWKKGETSGELLKVVEILTDCDQDVLQVKAEPQGTGASCHTGRRSCFYRRVEGGKLTFI